MDKSSPIKLREGIFYKTMFFLDTFRALKFAFQNFWRNIWLSLVTISIITLALVSVTCLLVFNLLANNVLDQVQAKSEIYIDLTAQAKQAQIDYLVEELNKLPDIREVRHVTPEETLTRFRANHADDEVVIASLESLSNNPFQGSIFISVNNIEQFSILLNEISRPEYSEILEIDNAEFYQARDLIQSISNYSNQIQKFGFFISLFFVLISIIVVANTIQMGIYSHREEISIMKLVGASNWFIRAPHIIEGILYSLVACVILIALFYPLAGYLQPRLDSFLGDYSLDLIATVNANFLWVIGLEIIIAILITTISGLIATRKYLRV